MITMFGGRGVFASSRELESAADKGGFADVVSPKTSSSKSEQVLVVMRLAFRTEVMTTGRTSGFPMSNFVNLPETWFTPAHPLDDSHVLLEKTGTVGSYRAGRRAGSSRVSASEVSVKTLSEMIRSVTSSR